MSEDCNNACVRGCWIDNIDLERSFGVETIAQWSNLDCDGHHMDECTVMEAIEYAEDYVRGRIAKVCCLQCGDDCGHVLKGAMVDLAAYRLHRPHRADDDANATNDSDRLDRAKQDAEDVIASVLAGNLTLPCCPDKGRCDVPRVVGTATRAALFGSCWEELHRTEKLGKALGWLKGSNGGTYRGYTDCGCE